MRARSWTAAVIAAALLVPAGTGTVESAAAERPSRLAKKLRPIAFDDCPELAGSARRYASRVEPYYAPGGPVAVDTIRAPLPPSPGGAEGTAGTDTQTAQPSAP